MKDIHRQYVEIGKKKIGAEK
jgi:hypothetical protein